MSLLPEKIASRQRHDGLVIARLATTDGPSLHSALETPRRRNAGAFRFSTSPTAAESAARSILPHRVVVRTARGRYTPFAVRIVIDPSELPLEAPPPAGPPIPPRKARDLVEASGFRFPRRNVLFHCLKGGAAKTTLAYNTAYRLAQYGARVLLVDLDKQANATLSLLGESPMGGDRPVFVDVVTGKATIHSAIVPVAEGLDVLPSSLDNARLEIELSNRPKNPERYFRSLFAPVRERYDFVLFDMPPDLSHGTYLASLYADCVCVPTSPDEYGVYGTRLTLGSLEGLLADYEGWRPDIWVVWTRFDPRERGAARHIAEFDVPPFAQVFPLAMRTDVTYKRAQESRKSVFGLRRQSNAKDDLDALARAIAGFPERVGAA